MDRASEAGRESQAASASESTVHEKERIQALFAALLPGQPQAVRGSCCVYKVHHVHSEESVCGSLKPDAVISIGEDGPLSSSTVLVLALQCQDGAYCSLAHMLQVRLKSKPALPRIMLLV